MKRAILLTLIASLVLFIPPSPDRPVFEGGTFGPIDYSHKSIARIEPLEELVVEEVAEVVEEPIPAPPEAPAPTVGCGDDQYKVFIYQHESGCNTGAINSSSGACGLGQAWPCSKMPCSLSDWVCQDSFFTTYAMNRYGSWYEAYLYWTVHSNW